MDNKLKKVLIITFYWPPMGGGGVQRWLKMVKYLREYGWEPIIFTAKNASNPIHDESLFHDLPEGLETIRQEVFEPYGIYNKLLGRKTSDKVFQGFVDESGKSGFIKNLSVWLRGNIFIPDARMFWIKPSKKRLKKFLRENHVDAIISTGPPHSTHIIAKYVSKKFRIPWLADFRDPWTNIDFYNQLKLTKLADARHRYLEKSVMKGADKLVTVTWNWGTEMEEIRQSDVKVITNGFDPEDFKDATGKQGEKFNIIHAGSLNRDRNPDAFWQALKTLLEQKPELKNDLSLDLIGPVDFSVLQSLKKFDLETYLNRIDNLPHREVVQKIMEASVLLLPLNDTPNISGVVPGKLYEYIGAKRPIIAIGNPNGDSAKILKETESGLISDFGDSEAAFQNIKSYYEKFLEGKLTVNSKNAEKYSRRNLAGEICKELDSIVQN